MKKLLTVLVVAIAVFTLALPHPDIAADTVNGAKVFSAKAACHLGGR